MLHQKTFVQIDFQPGELKINTWPALYQSPGGKKFRGRLIVTNKRLLYDSRFDLNVKGFIPDKMFVKWGTLGYLEIYKSEISNVIVKGFLFGRKTEIVLTDGSKHTFNCSILNDSRMINAINKDRVT